MMKEKLIKKEMNVSGFRYSNNDRTLNRQALQDIFKKGNNVLGDCYE